MKDADIRCGAAIGLELRIRFNMTIGSWEYILVNGDRKVVECRSQDWHIHQSAQAGIEAMRAHVKQVETPKTVNLSDVIAKIHAHQERFAQNNRQGRIHDLIAAGALEALLALKEELEEE